MFNKFIIRRNIGTSKSIEISPCGILTKYLFISDSQEKWNTFQYFWIFSYKLLKILFYIFCSNK